MTTEQMQDLDRSALVDQLTSIANSGRYQTRKALAQEIDIAASTLSEILSGHGDKYGDGHFKKICAFLRRLEEKKNMPSVKLPEEGEWIETPTSLVIQNAINYAFSQKTIVAIYGGSGLGKTHTAEYVERMNPGIVTVVKAFEAAKGAPVFLKIIARKLNAYRPGQSQQAADLFDEIVAKLNGTRRVLIIDEFNKLTHGAMEAVRDIHDFTNTSLVWMGNIDVANKLTGGKADQERLSPLTGRVGKRVPIHRPKPADADALADAFGIVGREERDFLRHIVGLSGGLRNAQVTMRDAYLAARANDSDAVPTIDHLRMAFAHKNMTVWEDV